MNSSIKEGAIPIESAGQKRQRSSSPLQPPPKRQVQSADPPPVHPSPKPRATEPTEDIWLCPGCGRPCIRCPSITTVPPDLPRLHEEVSTPQSMEPPSAPTSSVSVTQTTSTTPSPSTIQRKKRKLFEHQGLTYIGPRDNGFKERILDAFPVNLEVSEASDVAQISIFDDEMHNPSSRVVLELKPEDLEKIMGDFREYMLRGCNEAALTAICYDWIVRRDPFISNDFSCNTQVLKSVRYDKWKPKQQGPPIPLSDYVYDWDLEPDSTYAVSINMFSAEVRRKLLQIDARREWLGWLADHNTVCPYLTLEYKSAGKGGKQNHATYQTVAAAMLWLYQLKRIVDALDQPLDSVRHYMITIVDATYTISIAGITSAGYETATLAEGSLKKIYGLKEYIRWSNAIHAWGLGPHATSFKKNILDLLHREQDQPPLPTPEHTDLARSLSAAAPLNFGQHDTGE